MNMFEICVDDGSQHVGWREGPIVDSVMLEADEGTPW